MGQVSPISLIILFTNYREWKHITIPNLTQGRSKCPPTGLGVMESNIDINLYFGNFFANSILLQHTHPGLSYVTHRHILLCYFCVCTRTSLPSGTLLCRSSIDRHPVPLPGVLLSWGGC